MTIHAVYPGSFEPFTLGHLDVVARASVLFDKLTILVVHNPHKTARIDVLTREQLIKRVLSDHGLDIGISVEHLQQGLLVERCKELGANLIIKGVRNSTDAEYETPMATVNRDLSGIETLYLPASPELAHISSSLVRQVASLGGDVSQYVPDSVNDWLISNKGGY